MAGQAAIVDLNGALALTDVLVKAPATMVAQIEDDDGAKVGASGELIGALRDLIEDTKSYMRRKAEFERAQTRQFIATRRDLEAMIPVVEGREPLTIVADQAAEIREALSIAKDYGIKVVIAGRRRSVDDGGQARRGEGAGAHRRDEQHPRQLQHAREPAGERGDASQGGRAGRAHRQRRGGDEELFNIRNLRYEAGNAVAYGMSWDDALRAITLAPAEIFGVADKVGSLEGGARRERRDLERRSVRVLDARGAGVRARQEDRCAVAAGHAREAVQDPAAEVQHALISLEFRVEFRPARIDSRRPFSSHSADHESVLTAL